MPNSIHVLGIDSASYLSLPFSFRNRDAHTDTRAERMLPGALGSEQQRSGV
jgi:hypothetical protein